MYISNIYVCVHDRVCIYIGSYRYSYRYTDKDITSSSLFLFFSDVEIMFLCYVEECGAVLHNRTFYK